jgi:endonuclease/exonuclease/phosphatase family metal-dependent hydrolase
MVNRFSYTLPWLTAILLLCSPVTHAEEGRGDSPPLRVLTYNLLHDGAWSGFFESGTHLKERLDISIQELKRLQPDIIALQEASDSRKHGNVPQQIADALGYQMVFAPATERVFGLGFIDRLILSAVGFKEGPAILSRHPIIASEIYDLPRCQRKLDPRILLRAEIETPGGPTQVFSAHTSKGDDCQLQRVGELVREHRGTGRAILMGDLNTGEQSPVLTEWQKESGFIDVFRVANPGVPGGTVWQNIQVEWPTADRRVDFIFLLYGNTNGSSVVRSSRLVFDQPGRLPNGDALWPSDHRGVLAEIGTAPSGNGPTEVAIEKPSVSPVNTVPQPIRRGPNPVNPLSRVKYKK